MSKLEIDRDKGTVGYENENYRMFFRKNKLQIVDDANEIFSYDVNTIADLFAIENELLEELLANNYELKRDDISFFRRVREMIAK